MPRTSAVFFIITLTIFSHIAVNLQRWHCTPRDRAFCDHAFSLPIQCLAVRKKLSNPMMPDQGHIWRQKPLSIYSVFRRPLLTARLQFSNESKDNPITSIPNSETFSFSSRRNTMYQLASLNWYRNIECTIQWLFAFVSVLFITFVVKYYRNVLKKHFEKKSIYLKT